MRALNRTAAALAVAAVCSIAPVVQAQCSWNQVPTGIAFGTYSVFSAADAISNGSYRVRCTRRREFVVALSRGGAPSYTPRMMSGTAAYNLYSDVALTTIWGDGNGGTSTFGHSNTSGGTVTYTDSIFGSVPALQDLAPGAYSDTITATLTWRRTTGGGWTTLPGVTFPVTMNIVAECRVDTFDLSFGNYDPFTVALNQTTTVKVYCTRTTPATLSLDNGANASGVQKRMRSGASFLNYTATLATGSPPASTSALVPLGGGVSLNGTVPAAQDVPVGSYLDTLQVIVNY